MTTIKKTKFEQSVRDNIVKPYLEQGVQDGYGIVLLYAAASNTATVMMAQNGSDLPGEVYHSVPCPVQMGVQGVAPEKGRQCWVTFKNHDGNFPLITHFYNYYYDKVDYVKQNKAVAALPRFIYNL